MNRWSVHVKHFGKIKEAVVEVSPMTLFLGDNNSGKSYMMTLLYGLLNIRLFFSKYDFAEDSPAYQKCVKVLERNLNWDAGNSVQTFKLTPKECIYFSELLNTILEKNKEIFLRDLFNKEMEIGQIQVSFPEKMDCSFKISRGYSVNDKEAHMSIFGMDGEKSIIFGYSMPVNQFKERGGFQFFLAYMIEFMLKDGFTEMGRGDAVYFPMARTGFLLTYKSLVGSAMQDKFNLQETSKNLLTKPNSDFLTALSQLDTLKPREEYREIVEFIEQQVIHGRVRRTELPSHEILYTPEGQEKQLPMFVVSGVVTEMAPLLLFLQYTNLGTLLMEEPEISLHPELQWTIARVLIRIHNKGVPVFVTTHSDIILQHVNNMLKLEEAEGKEAYLRKLGYDFQDLLKREDVAVYQFDVDKENWTMVTRLPCGDYGFEAMTFYNTLKKLNDQIDCIEKVESEEA